jgi:hypothetical protein
MKECSQRLQHRQQKSHAAQKTQVLNQSFMRSEPGGLQNFPSGDKLGTSKSQQLVE